MPKTPDAKTEAQRNRNEDIKRGRALELMMSTEGWRIYDHLINHHISLRTANLFDPTPSGGRDAEQHNKGAIYGLIFARDLPRVTVGAAKELVREANTGDAKSDQPDNEGTS
jgi:hypothetical protein